MRQQFPFYKSFDDIIEELTDIQLANYIRTLLDVQFLRVRIDDVEFKDKILNIIWKSQKHSIGKSINGFLDGQKRETIKNPYFGVYGVPTEGVHEGLHTPDLQVQGKEEVKGQVKGQGKEEGKEEVQVIPSDIIYINESEDSNSLFLEYLALRKKMKLSNSDSVIKRLLNKLREFEKKGHHSNEVILNAINSSWKDFYEPKNTKNNNQPMSFKQQDKQIVDNQIDMALDNNIWDIIDSQSDNEFQGELIES